MGYRLYSAKTYKVELDRKNTGFFNNIEGYVNRLIFGLCPNASFNDESPEQANSIEIDREEFMDAVNKLKEDQEGVMTNFLKLIAYKDYTPEDVVNMFHLLYDSADPANDYIVLQWF